jgi:hypothetical protein
VKDPSSDSGKELTPKRVLLITASSLVGFFAGLTALRIMEKVIGID